MADFRARVEAYVDTSRAASDINSFINQQRRMNIEVNLQLNQASQALHNLLQQMQNQGGNAGAQFAGQFVNAVNSGMQQINATQTVNQIEKQTNRMTVNIRNNMRDLTRQNNAFNETTARTFGNQMTAWARNNGKAVKAYGDQLNDLQIRLNTAIAKGDGSAIKQIREEFRLLQSEARATGNVGKTFTQSFSSALGSVAKFAASYVSLYRVFNELKQGVQTVVELDTALVDLQKTSSATPSQLNAFYKEANDIAKQYGTTTQQIIQGAADWSRLGYNLQDSQTMSKLSSQFAAISPGMSVDTATSSLVSTMKAFGIGADDVLDGIMSKVNAVGNSFALTNQDIMTALQNSSSAMAVANNSLDETIALITAGTEIVQDSSKVGNALRTISMRIRGMNEETEELDDGLVNIKGDVYDLTNGKVSIMEDADTYKSTVQVLREVSDVWDELSDKAQANLLEKLFGKTRAQVGAAILSNFDQVEKALEVMANSAGNADKEMNIITNSLEYKINALRETFTGIWQNLFQREDMGAVIDGLTSILGVIDTVTEHLGLFKTALLGFSIAGIIKNFGAIKDFIGMMTAAGGLKSLGDVLAAIQIGFEGIASAIGVSASALASFIGIIGLVAVAAHIIDKVHESAKEANEKMANSFQAYEEAQSKVETINQKLQETEQAMATLQQKKGLTFVEEQELQNLERATELLQIQADLAQKERDAAAKQAAKDTVNAFNKTIGNQYSDEDWAVEAEWYGIDDIYSTKGIRELASRYIDQGSSSLYYSGDNESDIIRGLLAYEGASLRKEKQYEEVKDLLQKNYDELSYDDQALVDNYYETVDYMDYVDAGLRKQLELLTTYKSNLEALPADQLDQTQLSALAQIDSIIGLIYQSLDPGKWKQIQFDKIFNHSKFAQAKQDLLDMALASENLGITANDVKNIFSQYDGLEDELANAGISIEDVVNNINSQADIIDEQKLKDNIKQKASEAVDEATDEIKSEEETVKQDVKIEPNITVANDEDEKAKFDEFIDSLPLEQAVEVQNLLYNPDVDTSSWNVDDYRAYIDSILQGNSNLEESNKETTKSVEDVYNSFKTNFDKISGVVKDQATGKSISVDDFSSDELRDYSKALEYHNSVLQYNAEKVAEISKAKAEEAKQTIATNKAMEQSKYFENAKQIETLRSQLASASESEKSSIQSTIDSLLAQNAEIVTTCSQYDLMTSAINEATGAYQNWLNAQGAAQSGDMFDSALSAMQKINNTLNNSESDDYGRIGNQDYKAAVDFLVPDSVDYTDTEAVNSYMESISSLLTFDDKGNAKGLNIEEFCKQATDAGLMTLDEATNEYKVAGQKTMQDFADGLNLSLPLVRAMFGELEEFGGEFDWADEAGKSINDLAIEANEAAESLRKIEGNEDIKLVLDVSEFENKETAIATLDDTIQQMNDIKAKPDVDASEIEYANTIIQYCVAQQQLLNAPAVMHVDTSQVTGELGHALELLQQFQSAKNQVEMQASIGADTSEAQAELDSLVAEIQGLSTDTLVNLGIDPASEATITASIEALSPQMIVDAGVDESLVQSYVPPEKESTVKYNVNSRAPDNYQPSNKSATVVYHINASAPASYRPRDKTATVTYYINTVGSPPKGGSFSANGTAHAYGTARARGDWGTSPGGTTLVGELGQEIVVDPHSGLWYTVGDNGAEFRDIPKGAIVFNHLQSKSLLENGYAIGRAAALATGTAMVTGGIKMTKYTSSSSSGSSSSSSSSGSGYRSSYNYSAPSSSYYDDDYSSSSSSSGDDESEKLDWIEIAIARIERLIENLGRVAENTFKKLANRLKATDEEIEAIGEEIAIQQASEKRYLEEAASVGLSETLAEKVRNGSIDISEYSEDTQELIKDYQEWYEKALDCADAVEELHDSLATLYQDRFKMVEDDFNNQLSILEHLTNTYDNGIEDIEERGYLMTTKYYEASRKVEQENIAILNKELTELIQKMSDGINSGEIEEGSEAWYEMQISINDVKEAIQEANTEMIKFDNSIRNTKWEHFDYLQERISDITKEADFLINLMEHSDLFNDTGQLSSTGMATMGIHGQNYNTYMNQADRYADEINRINKEIAKNNADTELIARREELLDLQRESILNAEDEKEAIISLVKDGIDTELKALKDVISSYKESLETAKDLYDYQKKIRNQAKEVSDIQKQLSAYSGDNSEENRATIQKLNSKLNEAVEKLEETEQERTIKEQKEMLDNLYSEYEEILNNRLDNVDVLISDTINTINDNAASINDTIKLESADVGYTLSENMRSIWSSGGEASSIISKYGDSFLTEMTSVNIVLSNISNNIAKMIGESDTISQSVISTTTKTTSPNKPAEKPKPAPTPEQETSKSNTRTDQDYYGVAFAILEGIYGWGAGDDRVSRLKSKGFDSAKMQSLVNSVYGDYMNDRFSKYGISSDLSKYGYNKYLDGGLVKYTGLAQVDGSPSRPESFLDATDTANLAKLTSAMRTTSPFARNSNGLVNLRSGIADGGVGDIIYNINIPIEHVSDYNDFMNQMRQDNKFEKFVQSVTIGRINGENRLSKNKYKW